MTASGIGVLKNKQARISRTTMDYLIGHVFLFALIGGKLRARFCGSFEVRVCGRNFVS